MVVVWQERVTSSIASSRAVPLMTMTVEHALLFGSSRVEVPLMTMTVEHALLFGLGRVDQKNAHCEANTM